jgi:phosphoglycolate phosphatase-like HAD superfamily hydrolase
MNVAVAYEGVMVKEDDHNAPIQEAVDMVRAMAAFGRVVILAEASTQIVERFLAIHKVDKVVEVISGAERPGPEPLVARQIAQHRANGTRLDMVVVSDPSLVTWALEARLATLLFLAPWSVPPKFRPDDDAGRPTWEQIEADLDSREPK